MDKTRKSINRSKHGIPRGAVLFLAAMALLLLFAAPAPAITVVASPNPAKTNQGVSVSISAYFIGTASCPIQVNFGDNAVWAAAGNCGGGTCNLSANHVYLTAGNYTISARSQGCLPGPTAPDPANAVITVTPVQAVTSSVAPSSFKVQSDAQGIQPLLYNFTAAIDTNLQSPYGTFTAGTGARGTVLGTVNVPLTAAVKGGVGTATEQLVIPISIIQKAMEMQATNISYSRTFSDGMAATTVQTEASITTAAGANFSVTRIRLYFDNGRPEITMKKSLSPVIHAELSFTGSGLLQGYWEVDGRTLSVVTEHLTFSRTVILTAPAVPPLPAFEPGPHRVRLVITSPPLSIALPEASYYVEDGTAGIMQSAITPVFPADGAVMDYAPMSFRWTDKTLSARYLLEVFDAGDKHLVFSAQVKAPEYQIPEIIMKQLLAPGGQYLWRVTGWDTVSNKSGESPLRVVSFKAP